MGLVPDVFLGFRGEREIRLNDVYDGRGSFDDVLSKQRRHNVVKNWTDGLITPPEQVLREALDAYWSAKGPPYEEASAEDREMIRRMRPETPTIEDISGLIDFTKRQQTGPVLVVEKDSWRFEEPASRSEKLPFLVALTDPHYYHLPFTGPYGSLGDAMERERLDRIANQKPSLRTGWRYR
jgi:hypothetical protein